MIDETEISLINNNDDNNNNNKDDNNSNNNNNIPIIDRSKRAYSKKGRVYIFREFLLETYQDYFNTIIKQKTTTNNKNTKYKIKYNNNNVNNICKDDDDEINNNDIIILDVAGGKGDLSWLLTHVDNIKSIVLDPRTNGTNNHISKSVEYLINNPNECHIRSIRDQHTYQPIASLVPHLIRNDKGIDQLHKAYHMKIYVNKHLVNTILTILSIYESDDHNINEVDDDMIRLCWNDYWEQCSLHNRNDTAIDMNDMYCITDSLYALYNILNANLIVGFHPDQATDYCIELAKLLSIPFAIVPCCVFPSEFIHRKIFYCQEINEEKDEESNEYSSNNNKDNDNNKDDDDDDDDIATLLLRHQIMNGNNNIISTTTTNNNNMIVPKNKLSSSSCTTHHIVRSVKRYNDLLLYLLQQHPNIRIDTLPFEGTMTAKNIVLYTVPTTTTLKKK